MKREDFEKLGDKHKKYEAFTESVLMPWLPVVVRLDGRSFHTFTKGLKRPYDARMSEVMIETTKYLLDKTGADIGYCQSDEITIAFSNEYGTGNEECTMMFSGRVQKIVSIFASIASVRFNQLIAEKIPEKSHLMPVFDARVFQYPSLALAAETFLWRETDATRNSLSMAVQSLYNHKDCMGAGFKKKHDMLYAKGVNWNDYPAFFKRGTYVAKREFMMTLNKEELDKIPVKFREPGKTYSRNSVVDLELECYTKLANPVGVFFRGEEPGYFVGETWDE